MKLLKPYLGDLSFSLIRSEWLKVFYLSLFIICLYEFTLYSQWHLEGYGNPTWIWQWLSAPSSNQFYIWIVFASLSLSLYNCIQSNVTSRSVLAISLWLMDSYKASFNKVDHNMIGWCWVASILIFHKDDVSLAYRIHQAQFLVLINYLWAGLWKIKALIYSPLDAWEAIYHYLPYQILQTVKVGNPVTPLIEFLYSHKNILAILTVSLIALEVLPLLAINKKRVLQGLGLIFLLFHLLSFIVLKVNYSTMVILWLVLFVVQPIKEKAISS